MCDDGAMPDDRTSELPDADLPPPDEPTTLIPEFARVDDTRSVKTFALPDEERKRPRVMGEAQGTPAEPSPSDDPEEPVRYAFVKTLGEGGIGEVHAAADSLLGRTVALKVTKSHDPRMRKLFWHEARVTAMLDHPNIVPVYDAGVTEGKPFFTMKQIVGKNLVEEYDSRPDFSTREKLDVFRSVCGAMEYAHAKRWLHRDLKPDNVMLGTFGEVLVVDWGLARNLDSTRKASPAGTPYYMPPEQANGEVLDERVDVYALGGMLWFLLTGNHPWYEFDPMVVVARLQAGLCFEPPRGDLEPELHAIVAKAMAADKHDRYPTVRALREDLLAYIDGRPVGALTYTRMQRVAKWVDRNRRPLLGASLLASAVFAVVAVAALIAGLGVYRSAVISEQAAQTSLNAEQKTRAQLIEALLAGANAHIANGRHSAARDDLIQADTLTADSPDAAIVGLAWSDLTTRGVWPVATTNLGDGAVEVAVGSFVLVMRSDADGGRFETRDLRTLEVRNEGAIPGTPLRIVSPREILAQDGDELVLVDVIDGELARATLPDGAMRIQDAWKAGDRVIVQPWQDGTAPPATAWTLPELQPSPLPDAVTGLYLHDVGPLGQRVLGSVVRHPDRDVPAELLDVQTGRRITALDSARVILGRDAVYATEGDEVVARYLYGGDALWRQPSRPVLLGAEARRRDVAMADDGGGIFIATAEGDLTARLLGLDERPRDLDRDRSGRWLAALGTHGQLSVWGLPESDVGWMAAGPRIQAAAPHPDGRLLAVARDGQVQILDLPTGVVVASEDLPDARRIALAWSPDGRALALSTPHLERLSLEDGGWRRERIVDVSDGVRTGPVVWTPTQAVHADATGVRVLDPATLQLREDHGPHGVFTDGVALEDGTVVLAAGQRADDQVGVSIAPDGSLSILEGQGSAGVAGLGIAQLGGGVAIARQDGRLLLRNADGQPAGTWSWQGAPLTGVVARDRGAVAVGLDGRLHLLTPDGEDRYATEFSRRALDWVHSTPHGLVFGGEDGVRLLPLDGRVDADPTARLVHARAWSLLEGDEALSDTDQLSIAVAAMADGRPEALARALGSRSDAEAAILKAARPR